MDTPPLLFGDARSVRLNLLPMPKLMPALSMEAMLLMPQPTMLAMDTLLLLFGVVRGVMLKLMPALSMEAMLLMPQPTMLAMDTLPLLFGVVRGVMLRLMPAL